MASVSNLSSPSANPNKGLVRVLVITLVVLVAFMAFIRAARDAKQPVVSHAATCERLGSRTPSNCQMELESTPITLLARKDEASYEVDCARIGSGDMAQCIALLKEDNVKNKNREELTLLLLLLF